MTKYLDFYMYAIQVICKYLTSELLIKIICYWSSVLAVKPAFHEKQSFFSDKNELFWHPPQFFEACKICSQGAPQMRFDISV